MYHSLSSIFSDSNAKLFMNLRKEVYPDENSQLKASALVHDVVKLSLE